MTDTPEKILIIRLSAIGDVVRVLPALHVLRNAFPKARIDWVVERRAVDIVSGHPALDNVYVFERTKKKIRSTVDFFSLLGKLRAQCYDTVLDFHGILKSGAIMAASGARRRIGFAPFRARECSYLAAKRWVRLGSSTMNRIEENLALCGALVPRVSYPAITIAIPHEVQSRIDEYYEHTFDSAKMVMVLHVPVERREKQWPLEHFAHLCDLLLADGRFEVMLTWGPGQRQTVERVFSMARRTPSIAPETPSLKHLAALLGHATLFVGGDTGPMHIAAAMGTPVIAIFGGTDPARHAPYMPPYEILYSPPGPRGPMNAWRERLEQITPEMAYDACIRLLTRLREERPTPSVADLASLADTSGDSDDPDDPERE